ncbi:MAG: G5 domain-containing protein [Anaerolineae bacterium]|nr:G5 domain-containing protein [Anaerolineae bacterium]
MPHLKRSLIAGLLAAIFFTAACQSQPAQVFIDVDGGRQTLTTEAETVRAALDEARIVLGPLDRVSPDLYAQLEPGLVIVVTRVTEKIEAERKVIPFERQTLVNEALSPGETRLAQLGVSGEDEISIRVVYENGIEVSRTEISRTTVIEPIPEILVVGPKQNNLPSRPIEGVIAYLSGGNAWLMRNSSGSRRALTTAGDLDGRVFSLAPDGRQLVYTTKLTNEIELPLNEMWLASTTIIGEQPITLGIQGVLHAQWSPVVTQPLLAYSTAQRTANPPGWQANNDLWLLDLSPDAAGENIPQPVEIIKANTRGLYPWWGTDFAWSPDGTKLAYTRADQLGLIRLAFSHTLTASLVPLVDFTPLKTFSEWVWTPGLSWSPDGKFIAAAIHGPPLAAEPDEESQVFDLWLLGVNGTISAKVVEQVGMWANPAWGQAGIAFGQALNPLQSVNSRYTIQLIDRDGSNKRQLFPFSNQAGVQLPELVWSPAGDTLLFIYNGDLYLTGSQGSPPQQLTMNSQASRPQWVAQVPELSGAGVVTPSQAITSTPAITPGPPLTPATATFTPEPTAIEPTLEPTATLTATDEPEADKE